MLHEFGMAVRYGFSPNKDQAKLYWMIVRDLLEYYVEKVARKEFASSVRASPQRGLSSAVLFYHVIA
jgi:hypothetical protein